MYQVLLDCESYVHVVRKMVGLSPEDFFHCHIYPVRHCSKTLTDWHALGLRLVEIEFLKRSVSGFQTCPIRSAQICQRYRFQCST
jgi:hypothetical protein